MICKYTRPLHGTSHYPDPDPKYGVTTVEQTSYGSDKDWLCYVDGDIKSISTEFKTVELTDQQAIDFCEDIFPTDEGEEFTVNGGRIIDNRTFNN